MNRKLKFSIGEFYHIYNRGNDKRPLFLTSDDSDRFSDMLFLCNSIKPVNKREIPKGVTFGVERSETIVDIGAYCLMPNHFHLLVREKTEEGITKFMKKLSTGYSMYFNIKNKRSGKLFEGAFKAVHVDKDEYLKYLFAYIHLNPIKLVDPLWKENGISSFEKSKQYLSNYRYSSYFDYMGINRLESLILNKSEFPEYFNNFKEFENFTNEWIKLSSTKVTPLGGMGGMEENFVIK